MFLNTQYDGAAGSNTSSRHRKRKLTSPSSFENDERTVLAKKKRKKVENYFDDILIMDNDFSIDLDLPEVSVPHSDENDIFEWMEDILGNETDELSLTEGNDKSSCESIDVDSFLSLNESDSCYEEMISLLAEGGEDVSNGEENVFKKIQESFIADQLLGDHSKSFTLKRSPSFGTRLGRTSRIGIREGLTKLAKANSRSAKTRRMLLNCRLSFAKKSSQ